MILKKVSLSVCAASVLLAGIAQGAKIAPSSILAPEKPLTTRLHEADKVFVAELVNKKMLANDWCHADLKVTRALKGVKQGELIPVVWRPKIAKYDAEDKQIGLAVLNPAHEKRYWLRPDTFVDVSFAEQAAHSLGKTDGILREYVDRGVLTKEEEKIIIELAKQQGIEKVAKIRTFYLRPSSARGISVIGVEQVKGREVSYKVLNVNRKGWSHRGVTLKEGTIVIGNFSANKAWERKSIILMVGKNEYRISKPHGLTVEQCESMLKLLRDGKFTLGPNSQKERLKGIDWDKPMSFSKFGDNINLSFRERNNGDGHYSLRVSLDNGKLSIKEIMLAMP